MKERKILVGMLALGLLLALAVGLVQAQTPRSEGAVVPAAALGTAFTYQGRLLDGGSPADGDYDFQFMLYDAVSGGSQVGSTIPVDDQPVSEGLFTVELDFGGVFDGTALWLEIGVRPGDSTGAYTILTPRQPLSAAPYALSLPAGAIISGTVPAGSGLTVVNNHDTGRGVYGLASATSGSSYGVYGQSESTAGRGVFGIAPSVGVYGRATATSGTTRGLSGTSYSTDGRGVEGIATANSGTTYGVYGLANSPEGLGVYGQGGYVGVWGWAWATSGVTYGVYGRADSTDAHVVAGHATATTGPTRGVVGRSDSDEGRGVYGLAAAASGTTYGVFGHTYSSEGYGVYGVATAASGTTTGVYGGSASPAGYGVYGWATATTGPARGVVGRSDSTEGYGVYGVATTASGTTSGVYGESRSNSTGSTGVVGRATATNGSTFGIRGLNDSTAGVGVYGWAGAASGTNYGVVGVSNSPSGYAGYFYGNVHVAGTLSKTGGSFKIDHPLDPANKYLYHSFVESPDMKNVYDGVVVLDESGSAWVDLPDWFEALNRDYRYQLTCIGGYAPVYIAQKIEDNRFQIAGGVPGMEVSWQVTGIRQDPWAEAHRIPVEQDKPEDERGTYLYPELYGQPEELGLDYRWTHGLPE